MTSGERGARGGRLVSALRTEPRTFNPVTAVDAPSREIIRRLHGDLVTIDRATQRTTLALARAVERSADGRTIVVRLRRGVRFSDGHPFDADDVVFTFRVHLDAAVDSPQRALLAVNGRPITVTKRDALTVAFTFAAPYGPGERIFDSLAMLPRHVLEPFYLRGQLGTAWGVGATPTTLVGLGPFRLRAYQPGQAIVLERNPHYWKRDGGGTVLPYLDELRYVFAANEEAQALRFEAGELDLVDRMGADPFQRLSSKAQAGVELRDLGPGLDLVFLMFNHNDLPGTASPSLRQRQRWFADRAFRHAISSSIDRVSIARLAFGGRATPMWAHVSAGNRLWHNAAVPRPPMSVADAKRRLAGAGFSWTPTGTLRDASGTTVSFAVLTSSGNAQRGQAAVLLQADLKAIGIDMRIVPMEFGALLERVMRTHDYDAALMALGSGDVDPGSDLNVWRSSGATHLWRLAAAPTESERALDRLLDRQMSTVDPRARRAAYNEVQSLVATELPVVPLVAPHVLIGAKAALGNLRPGIIDHHVLWNADEIFWRANTRPRP